MHSRGLSFWDYKSDYYLLRDAPYNNCVDVLLQLPPLLPSVAVLEAAAASAEQHLRDAATALNTRAHALCWNIIAPLLEAILGRGQE